MDGGSRPNTKLKWPNTHEFMFTEKKWSWGNTASDVVAMDASSEIAPDADAVGIFENMFAEQEASLSPQASSSSVPPIQDAAVDDLPQDPPKTKPLEIETAMKHCGKAINEWNGKVRTYRGTLKRANDHVNTKNCIVANQMTALVKEGDSSLTNLLTVDVKHKGKQPVTAIDIATIARESAAIYNTVKTCNKKNAGLVNLFSC